jgi:cell division protein FtsB
MKMRNDSIRGWIAICLVAIGGLGASLHSYYAGRADVLVLQSQIEAMAAKMAVLEKTSLYLNGEVMRLKTLHERDQWRR